MVTDIGWLLRHVDELPQASPPLLLLVGVEARLSAVLHRLQVVTQSPCIPLSHDLGVLLLEVSPRERMRIVARTFRALLRPYHQQMVFLDRMALLRGLSVIQTSAMRACARCSRRSSTSFSVRWRHNTCWNAERIVVE